MKGEILIFLPLANLWNNRTMVFHFAILNIKMRFQNTYLGFLWAALEPLLYFSVLYVVFTSIRETQENFAIYLITGIMLFHIFARGTSGGLVSLTSSGGIIKSVNVNREFFPVVATIAIGLLAFVDVGVFFSLMPIFQFVPSWTIILLPIPLILLLILILGLSYFLSIINVFVRDVQPLWTILVYSLLFLSPIFWRVKDVEGILLQIHNINPLGQLIDITHRLVISGQIPQLNEWAYTTSFVFAIFFIGYFVFRKFENRIVEEL